MYNIQQTIDAAGQTDKKSKRLSSIIGGSGNKFALIYNKPVVKGIYMFSLDRGGDYALHKQSDYINHRPSKEKHLTSIRSQESIRNHPQS